MSTMAGIKRKIILLRNNIIINSYSTCEQILTPSPFFELLNSVLKKFHFYLGSRNVFSYITIFDIIWYFVKNTLSNDCNFLRVLLEVQISKTFNNFLVKLWLWNPAM